MVVVDFSAISYYSQVFHVVIKMTKGFYTISPNMLDLIVRFRKHQVFVCSFQIKNNRKWSGIVRYLQT